MVLFACATVIAIVRAVPSGSAASASVLSAPGPEPFVPLMFCFGALAAGYLLVACLFYAKRFDGGAREKVAEDPNFFSFEIESKGEGERDGFPDDL